MLKVTCRSGFLLWNPLWRCNSSQALTVTRSCQLRALHWRAMCALNLMIFNRRCLCSAGANRRRLVGASLLQLTARAWGQALGHDSDRPTSRSISAASAGLQRKRRWRSQWLRRCCC